uniref:Uncharacterized protein n=1 Tax=Chrysotila carterae TaxID=13221 RepID=A0A7S4B7F9_CHRCT
METTTASVARRGRSEHEDGDGGKTQDSQQLLHHPKHVSSQGVEDDEPLKFKGGHDASRHGRCSCMALGWLLCFLATALLCPILVGINVGILYSLHWHGRITPNAESNRSSHIVWQNDSQLQDFEDSLEDGIEYSSLNRAPLPDNCRTPPTLMAKVLSRLVTLALKQLKMPMPPSPYTQHYDVGPLSAQTYNTTVTSLSVGSISVAACYDLTTPSYVTMPNSLIVHLYEAAASGTIAYELETGFGMHVGGGVASGSGAGYLFLLVDLDNLTNGTVKRCGGKLRLTSLELTGLPLDNPAFISADLASKICHGSDLDSYVGARRPNATGLVDSVNYEVRRALPELHANAAAAYDRTLFVIVLLALALLVLPLLFCIVDYSYKLPGESLCTCGHVCCCWTNIVIIFALATASLVLLFVSVQSA